MKGNKIDERLQKKKVHLFGYSFIQALQLNFEDVAIQVVIFLQVCEVKS